MNVNDILQERETTHGDYQNTANVIQHLKAVIREATQERYLEPYMAESLEMIAHKIGRICSGNARHLDHWVDIAGYSTLVVNELRKGKE